VCGISGLLTLDGRPADQEIARAMIRALAHRGPDGEGLWLEGPVALGHRRLAIRDLSPTGAQPFHSACGRIVVTYNGEIYNEAPLRAELEMRHGLVSRSTADTEIIPAGYLAWGTSVFDRIEGIFAIALWDRTEQRLILARDGVGVKPLYVQKDRNTVRFGSEVKALLADPSWRASIQPERLHTLLALGHLGPAEGLLAGVAQVPPGSIRVISRDDDRTMSFWRPSRGAGSMKAGEAVDALVDLLPRVVEEQLISDVPVGILQSGGIDSSLITMSLPRRADAPLFTVRFAEESYDETALAAAVAARAARRHIIVDLPDETETEATFRLMVHHLDGELADSSAFATLQLSREIKKHVTVALSGDGGDEFFAGYPTYRASRLAGQLAPLLHLLPMHKLGLLIRRIAGVSGSRIPVTELITRFCLGCTADPPHVAWRRYLDGSDASALYGPALQPLLDAKIDPLAGYAEAWRNEEDGILARSLLADQRYYLPADMLTKVDRTSMAFGLEVRVPLLDRRIADLSASISLDSLSPSRGPTKAILRAAAGRLGAPEDIVHDRKRGLNVPVNRWLAGPLRTLADRLCGKDAEIFSPFLVPDTVRNLWNRHKNGEINHGYVIWTLLTLGVRREQLGTRLADA
jgi:asparagine synthase (glutamine-hydrolysing)